MIGGACTEVLRLDGVSCAAPRNAGRTRMSIRRLVTASRQAPNTAQRLTETRMGRQSYAWRGYYKQAACVLNRAGP